MNHLLQVRPAAVGGNDAFRIAASFPVLTLNAVAGGSPATHTVVSSGIYWADASDHTKVFDINWEKAYTGVWHNRAIGFRSKQVIAIGGNDNDSIIYRVILVDSAGVDIGRRDFHIDGDVLVDDGPSLDAHGTQLPVCMLQGSNRTMDIPSSGGPTPGEVQPTTCVIGGITSRPIVADNDAGEQGPNGTPASGLRFELILQTMDYEGGVGPYLDSTCAVEANLVLPDPCIFDFIYGPR